MAHYLEVFGGLFDFSSAFIRAYPCLSVVPKAKGAATGIAAPFLILL